MTLLERIDQLQHKRTRVVLRSGDAFICEPLQYLEEEYESYLLEVIETSGDFHAGDLVEVAEEDLLSVEEIN